MQTRNPNIIIELDNNIIMIILLLSLKKAGLNFMMQPQPRSPISYLGLYCSGFQIRKRESLAIPVLGQRVKGFSGGRAEVNQQMTQGEDLLAKCGGCMTTRTGEDERVAKSRRWNQPSRSLIRAKKSGEASGRDMTLVPQECYEYYDTMEYKPIVVCWEHRGMLGYQVRAHLYGAMTRPRDGDWCCVKRTYCAGYHKLYLV